MPKYPELDLIVHRLACLVAYVIVLEARDVRSAMRHKAQYILEGLIAELQAKV